MRVAIIENMAGTPHGQLGIALKEAAADVHIIRAYAGEALPANAGEHDALIVLGVSRTPLMTRFIPIFHSLRF